MSNELNKWIEERGFYEKCIKEDLYKEYPDIEEFRIEGICGTKVKISIKLPNKRRIYKNYIVGLNIRPGDPFYRRKCPHYVEIV